MTKWVKTNRKVYPKDWVIGNFYCRQGGEKPFKLVYNSPHIGNNHFSGEYLDGGYFEARNSYLWECIPWESRQSFGQETKTHVDASAIEVGKWYTSPNGYTPFEVLTTEWLGDKVRCMVRDKSGTYPRTLGGAYELDQTETKDEEMTKTLYQIKGTETYGTLLAKNSEGKYVLEVKGTSGEVKTVAPDEVEEVIPHSVEVKFSGTGKGYYYFAPKDSLEVGDWVINEDGSFAQVTSVDCKSKLATKELMGRKLVTETFR